MPGLQSVINMQDKMLVEDGGKRLDSNLLGLLLREGKIQYRVLSKHTTRSSTLSLSFAVVLISTFPLAMHAFVAGTTAIGHLMLYQKVLSCPDYRR